MTQVRRFNLEDERYATPKLRGRASGRRRLGRIALLVLPIALATVAGVAAWGLTSRGGSIGSRDVLVLAVFGAAGGAAILAVQREMRVRRLTNQLVDERVLRAAYANRVRDLSALVATSRTINDVLELDEVLSILLDETLGVFHGAEGSIMLLDGTGFLQTVCARGNQRAQNARVKIGHSIAGHVALTREPLRVAGRADPERFKGLEEREAPLQSAMSVPLIHREEVLGVLNVNGADGRSFTDHDLQMLTVFAGHASIAIANARAFASERGRLSELTDLNRLRSELMDGISHELQGPIQGIAAGIDALRGLPDLEAGAYEAIETMGADLARLSAAVDRLLSEATMEHEPDVGGVATTDLAEMSRRVAVEFDPSAEIEVVAPETCVVTGDAGLLEQVLWNLLDNAFRYGEPPVRIEVRRDDDHGVVSVVDHGPGIAPGDRERIFERFSRDAGPASAMGLGLSIVHGVVSACGGRVWADDGEAGGAAFFVALPLVEGKVGREVGA